MAEHFASINSESADTSDKLERNHSVSLISDAQAYQRQRRCVMQESFSAEAPPDITPGKSRTDDSGDTPKWWLRTRMHVALLGLTIAAVNCYAQATFCIAIVEMVLPADYVTASSLTLQNPAVVQHDDTSRDQSCPIEYKYRDYYDSWRFPADDTATSSSANGTHSNSSTSSVQLPRLASSQTIDVSNRFDWDASQQGLLLGAFAVGTAPLQIVGGRLAEIYGAKWVLLAGCIGTALTNLTIPYLAHFSFVLLLVNRVLMGVAQAGMEPGLMCLLADWLTPQEAGFFISMLLFAICLGFFLGSLCSSFILALSYGWPLTYYVSGGLNLAVALVWYVYADSWPRASTYISEQELRYIEQEQSHNTKDLSSNSLQQHQQVSSLSTGQNTKSDNKYQQVAATTTTAGGAPWRELLSSRPVWAFIICKISIRWCADVLSNELPTYLASVLHLSIKINGLLNSVSTALFAISSFLTGWLATSELCLGSSGSSHELSTEATSSARSKTRLRKSFQSLASFGSALCLILMTQFDCDLLVSMSMLLVLSCCLVMGTGGELQIPYDMTSRYPGTLHGLACTLSVSGWLAPPLIGLILGDQPSSRARWSLVWYSTAAINLLGGLIFVLFADAAPRDFDKKKEKKNKKSQDDDTKTQDGGYVNDGLHNSSCESTPKLSATPHGLVVATQNQMGGESLGGGKTLNPLDATLTFFDSDQVLVKCRQSESSFIDRSRAFQINCTSNRYLDSVLRHDDDPIYPYRASTAHENGDDDHDHKDKDCSREKIKQTTADGSCCCHSEPSPTEQQRQSPPSGALSSSSAAQRSASWCSRLFFAGKRRSQRRRRRHSIEKPSTISANISALTNEKFMSNEQQAVEETKAAPTPASAAANETINHHIHHQQQQHHLKGSHNSNSDALNAKATATTDSTRADNQQLPLLLAAAAAPDNKSSPRQNGSCLLQHTADTPGQPHARQPCAEHATIPLERHLIENAAAVAASACDPRQNINSHHELADVSNLDQEQQAKRDSAAQDNHQEPEHQNLKSSCCSSSLLVTPPRPNTITHL